MKARALWKGFLKLGMVSCQVALHAAISRNERTSLHTLNRATGHRVQREYVDEVSGKAVPRENQVKGFETTGGKYVILSPEEVEAAIPEITKTIDLECFVKQETIDEVYLGAPYYLKPADPAALEAFALIRDAMKAGDVGGIAQTVLFRRDRALLLRPAESGMLVSILHFNYEVRSAEDAFEDLDGKKASGEMLDLAKHIIRTKKGRFIPDAYEDRYEAALADLIKAKQQGKEIKLPTQPKASNVINLLDALRESAGKKKARETASPKKSVVKSKSRGRASGGKASSGKAMPAKGKKAS